MRLFPLSTLKTIITACQGAQALHLMLSGLTSSRWSGDTISVAIIFFPLATLGLLRLPAALWLIDVESYPNEDEARPRGSLNYEPVSTTDVAVDYHTTRCWREFAVPLFYWVFIFFLFSISAASLCATNGYAFYFITLTQMVMGLFYIMVFGVTSVTFAFYFLRGHANTTVIPCISHIWYKIYTIFFLAIMAVVFIISVLETRKTPCGIPTTSPPEMDSTSPLCGNSTWVFPMSSPQRDKGILPWLAPVSNLNDSEGANWNSPFGAIWRMPNGTYEVVSFEGWCRFDKRSSTGLFNLVAGNISAG